ncbi:uncharacterized protein LOC111374911 [Olea europaea var. sylvestris]|uniref:uncharacterized protein LOC111374911 n=1 Tax=Olea europaea var. sylvestris TaxID=158386 RepID=UPI000C1CE98B|nr:uncharacterized protein LOC111374911 [Olea europaea var. sylvestris]
MNLQLAPDVVMCKAFPQTLTNAAIDWFSTLEPNFIASFSDLADKFSVFFASNKRIRKTVASLMQMRQGPNETLRNFMIRFNKERLQIPDLHITAAVSALTYAIKCEAFKMSLPKTPSKSVTELFTRAEKYINMEETMAPKREVSSPRRLDQKRPHESSLRQDTPRVKPRKDPPSTSFTRLNTSRSTILMEIKDSRELKWPPRLWSPPDTRDKGKYCDFHRDHGHTTEDCLALKQEIEALRKRGFLGSYISNDKRPRNNQNGGKGTEDRENKKPTVEDITFGTEDLEGIAFPYDDALVISAIIANFEVKRVLVDNRSAANVLSHEAFVQMGISSEQLKPVKKPSKDLEAGSSPRKVMQITTFEVVRTSMAYNAILGRPLLNRIRAIVSTFHLAMTFPTTNGIEVVRGNQTVARQCYVTSVRKIKNEVMQVIELELEHENHGRLAPVEGLEEVEIEHGRKVTIGRG